MVTNDNPQQRNSQDPKHPHEYGQRNPLTLDLLVDFVVLLNVVIETRVVLGEILFDVGNIPFDLSDVDHYLTPPFPALCLTIPLGHF